ncbi:MAG: glycosyltransferase [Bacilli bacterium]
MKKIIFCSKNLTIGGMENALVSLLNSIDKKQFDVTLVLEKKTGELLKDLDDNIKLIDYNLCSSKFILYRKAINFSKFLCWRIFKKNKYDFSCCYATYSNICNKLARCSSLNSLFYVHSNYYESLNHDSQKIKEYFDNLNISKFSNIAFVSNESMKGLSVVYPDLVPKFSVIGNIFPFERVLKYSKENVNFIKEKGITYFLFVGRMEEDSKQVKRLLNSINYAIKYNNNIKLLLIGDGPDFESYKKFVKYLKLEKYVLFLGVLKNPYPYYLLTDYVILTSNYEGFPVVYYEALFFNKKIITTVPTSDESIDINKEAIIVQKNETDIGEKIVQLLNKKENFKKPRVINFEKINNTRLAILYDIMNKKVRIK